jgi:C-terminal processing protease CtpA/Prc
MSTRRIAAFLALPFVILTALALSACVSSAPFQVPAPLAAAPAPATGDAAAAGGPAVIIGEAGSANFFASPETFPEPVVALIDAANVIKQEASFASDKTQILGTFDTAMFPLPAKYSINLPIQPAGTPIDLDNNGKTDTGVQVFALDVASNFTGDSYLQQLEQGGMASYLTDIATGEITEGAFLVYAADGNQGFPTGSGADKKWFTADDPAGPIPQGYSVARLGADGTVTLDRAEQATINTVERAEQASPDFSQQGILESFNSLIDTLKVRYAYTDLRKLDWEAIRARYLPQVEKADASQDMGAYFIALNELALSLRDGHVSASVGTNAAAVEAFSKWLQEVSAQFAGNLGAQAMAASDPADPALGPTAKIVVKSVGKGTPAEKAGWAPGTEIVTVDGQPVASRFKEIPLLESIGTEEAVRTVQAESMLSFPLSQTVTIGYKLPGAANVLTATMTAGSYPVDSGEAAPRPEKFSTAIDYQQFAKYAYLKWGDFLNDEQTKVAVLEEALKALTRNPEPALVLDLRGNGGGSVQLYMLMASYFFNTENPMPYNMFDWYFYDATAGTQIREYAPEYLLSAPKPELAYTGPLMVLVDGKCASACEYFSQTLQKLGRAKVVGQYATDGAGGPVDEIKLPEGMTFNYTYGRTTFAGTNEYNLEARGVVPDIRVPVTVESEQAKRTGQDPVLDAAVAELSRASSERVAQLVAQPWQWVSYQGADASFEVETPANYTLTFSDPETGEVKVKADCSNADGFFMLQGSNLSVRTAPVEPATCGEGSRSAQFLELLAAALPAKFAIADGKLRLVLNDGSTMAFASAK